MSQIPDLPKPVARVLDAFPPAPRRKLLQVRSLIYTAAARNSEIGPISETLKWGQPSYVPEAPRTGTAMRLGWSDKTPEVIHLFVHCQTTLIDTYRTLVGDELSFEGNRAIVVPLKPALPKTTLALCVDAAFTYYKRP